MEFVLANQILIRIEKLTVIISMHVNVNATQK